jgi:amino acid transporter
MTQLKRSLGLTAAIATACGLVVASTTLIDMGHGFGLAGIGFLIPMAIAMILNLTVAFTFGELSSMMPRAGAINHYTLPAMGPFIAIIAAISGYLIVNVLAGGVEAAIPGIMISEFFIVGIDPRIPSVIILLVLMFINIRGVDLFGWTQVVLTTGLIGSLVVFGIIGLTGVGAEPVVQTIAQLDPVVTGLGLLGLTGLAFWLFIGIEFVVPMAEEIRKPRIYIPLSMILALVIILVAKALFGSAAIRFVPLEILTSSEMPHLDVGLAMLGNTGLIWMSIVTIFATLATLNTLICGVPRILYGMAQKGQVPKIFAVLGSRQTPWFGIMFVTIMIMVPLLLATFTIETIVVYILASVISWFICYIIGYLDVIILRYKYPHVRREFKSPLGIIPQVVGIAAMVYMIINIYPDPEIERQIYLNAFIFIGIAAVYAALWVKFKMKKGLFETVPLEEIMVEDAEFEQKPGM